MSELDRVVAELLGRRIVPFVEENLDPGHDVPGVMHFDELTLVDHDGYLYVCDENRFYQDCDPENFTQLFHPSTDANQAQAAVREWCGEDWSKQRAFANALIATTDADGFTLYLIATATPEQLCRALIAAAKEVGK